MKFEDSSNARYSRVLKKRGIAELSATNCINIAILGLFFLKGKDVKVLSSSKIKKVTYLG